MGQSKGAGKGAEGQGKGKPAVNPNFYDLQGDRCNHLRWGAGRQADRRWRRRMNRKDWMMSIDAPQGIHGQRVRAE
eukprot:14609429-Heterocapsa_arctica.AAC.1